MTRISLTFLFALLLSLSSHAVSQFEWEKVKLGSIQSGFKAIGRVIPQEGALFAQSARVSGRAVRLLKREGDIVKKRDALIEITGSECVTLYQERKTAKEENIRELVEASRRRQDQLELLVDEKHCYVVAGSHGVITRRSVEPGNSFNVGQELFTIVNRENVTVELEVPERDINNVSVGQNVSFYLSRDIHQRFSSKIHRIIPLIDPVTRTSKIILNTVSLKDVPLDSLVVAEIETAKSQSTFIVPTAALVFHQDRQWIVKRNDPKHDLIAVSVLDESNSVSAIRPDTAGVLSEGDEVASKGTIFLFKERVREVKHD